MNKRDNLLDHVNRKPFPVLPFFTTVFIITMMLFTLAGAWHYVMYRWETETLNVSILRCKLVESEYKRDISRLYYENELALYRPPQLNDMEVE